MAIVVKNICKEDGENNNKDEIYVYWPKSGKQSMKIQGWNDVKTRIGSNQTFKYIAYRKNEAIKTNDAGIHF